MARIVKGKQPLGSAMWGMNPEIVAELLRRMNVFTSMTWDKCLEHNLKYYGEEFLLSEFAPRSYGEWYNLLKKIDLFSFIGNYHLKMMNAHWDDEETLSWSSLVNYVKDCAIDESLFVEIDSFDLVGIFETENGYQGFRTQIMEQIKAASHLLELRIKQQIRQQEEETARLMALQLQDELVKACEQGDVKATRTLLKKGAKPDTTNSTGKQPLGAAVWGMNFEIVDLLIKHNRGIPPLSWESCEQHNQREYKQTFMIIEKFDPKTYTEWYELLKKIVSPFLCSYYSKSGKKLGIFSYYNKEGFGSGVGSLEYVRGQIRRFSSDEEMKLMQVELQRYKELFEDTEKGYNHCRTRIKKR